MYTYTPLIDTSGYHFGWFISIGIIAFLIWASFRDGCIPGLGMTVFGAAILWVVHTVSYCDTPPVNKQVTAEFIGYMVEAVDRKSGKYTTIDRFVYANFKTPDGIVILRANAGVAMPKYVILYKN